MHPRDEGGVITSRPTDPSRVDAGLGDNSERSADKGLQRPRGAIKRRDRVWFSVAIGHGAALTLLGVLALIVFVPFYYSIDAALDNGFNGVRQLFADPGFWPALETTVELGAGSVVLAVVLGTVLAWWAHSLPPGRRWMGNIPLVPLVVPPLATILGYAFLFSPVVGFGNSVIRLVPPFRGHQSGPFNVYSVPWMIFITGLLLSSFVFLFVKTSLSQLQQELFDAAAVNHAGSPRTFFTVVVPLVRPAITYGAVTVFLLSLGQFTVPLFLGAQDNIQVLSTQLYGDIGEGIPNTALAAAYGLPIVIAGVVLLVVQNVSLRDRQRYVTSVTKGARPLRPSGPVAQACLLLYGVIAVALPLVAVVIVSLQPYWSRQVDPSAFTLANFRSVFDNPELTGAIRDSVTYALVTVLILLPLAYLCARVVYRRSTVVSRLIETVAMLPLGIPAVIFGLGFLLAYTQGPLKLYATSAGMVVVYVVLLLPFAVRIILTAMMSLGEDLNDAASMNGAGALRRTLTVTIPLLRTAFGSAAAIIVILVSQEFSASLLVRSEQTQVMGSVLYDQWNDGGYPQTAVMALVMCVVTGICVAIAVRLGGSAALGTGE